MIIWKKNNDHKGTRIDFFKNKHFKKIFASNGVRFELPGDIDIIDFRKTS